MKRTTVFRFLAACLARHGTAARRDAVPAQPANVDWATFVQLASETQVAPCLLDRAERNGLAEFLPQDVRSFLDGIAALNRQRNQGLRQEALSIGRILNRNGVTPVPIKGIGHLLSDLYPDAGHRQMIDIDLLVSLEQLGTSVEALEREGFRPLGKPGLSVHHHHPSMARTNVAVELHVEPVEHLYRPLISAEDMRATASRLTIEGVDFALPSPEARVVHGIVHAQLSDSGTAVGAISLRDLVDFDMLLAAYPEQLDWTRIASCFARSGQSLALDYHLLAASALLGVPSPPQVKPGRLAKALLRTALWQLDHPGFGDLRGRALWPLLQLRRSVSSAAHRRRLLANIADPAWRGRQWRRLRGQPIERPPGDAP